MFTAHVALSVGWLGAVVAYLALAVAGLTGGDGQAARAAYVSMELVGRSVIVPLSLAALLAGLVQSLGTEWGLFRHWWVVVKFVLTVVATAVLLVHMRTVGRVSDIASGGMPWGLDLEHARIQLVVHAAGGLGVLLVATVLSVYKPWGRTAYGRRKQIAARR